MDCGELDGEEWRRGNKKSDVGKWRRLSAGAGLVSSLQTMIEDWRDFNTKDACIRHRAASLYIYLKFYRMHESLFVNYTDIYHQYCKYVV